MRIDVSLYLHIKIHYWLLPSVYFYEYVGLGYLNYAYGLRYEDQQTGNCHRLDLSIYVFIEDISPCIGRFRASTVLK